MLGLPSLTNEGCGELETSKVVNIIYQLLQFYRHNLKTIEELKDRYCNRVAKGFHILQLYLQAVT